MADPLSEPTERTSHTDPTYMPPVAVTVMLRTWESVLSERYPDSRWTLSYDAPDD
jgi:hypothetical protein